MDKSNKYTGVYKNPLENKDTAYYITYKIDKKLKWKKVGLHSEGIREAYCSKKRASIMLKLRTGETILKNKTKYTLHDISIEFFKKKSYPTSSYRTIYGRYHNHLEPKLGKKQIDKIIEDDILDLNSKLSDKLAPKTTQLIIELLSALMNFAINEKKVLMVNPCSVIKSKKIDNARERYLELHEIRLLKEEINSNAEAYLLTLLLLSTGARLSDVYNIQKKQINLKNKTVRIVNKKGKRNYQAFLQSEILPLLKMDHLKPNDILFASSERSLQRFLKKTLDRLFNQGLDVKDAKNRVVVHTLRHTFASHLAIKGTPIYTIKKLMDHKSIEDTLRYAKLSPDNGRDFVEGLY